MEYNNNEKVKSRNNERWEGGGSSGGSGGSGKFAHETNKQEIQTKKGTGFEKGARWKS